MKKCAPKAFLVDKPNRQSVFFAGQHINLLRLANAQGIDQSYCSRIFAGIRTPSINFARRLSAALGMTLEDFLDGLQQRKEHLQQKREEVIQQHEARLRGEDTADLSTARQGKPVLARLPGLR